MATVPESFLASSDFAVILRAAGLDIDMDVFRMLEDARQLVVEGEMDVEEYNQLAKGAQSQLLQIVSGGSNKTVTPVHTPVKTLHKPSIIELPNENSIIESYLLKLPVTYTMNPLMNVIKKRYVVLYPTCIIYYVNKGDKQPKGRIDLNEDFYVQDSNAHRHSFILSDMSTTLILAADSEDLKGDWIHNCAMVLRKFKEHEEPIGLEFEDANTSRLQRHFERSLQRFKKGEGNRRQNLISRKSLSEDGILRDITDIVVEQTTKALVEREMQQQRKLEELQRRLNEAEQEKNKYKSDAEHEHKRAEEEARLRGEAERKLIMMQKELRIT